MKNDNAHSIRLADSLRKNIGSDITNDLEVKYPLSKSATIEKKFEWATAVCHYLEDHLEQDEIIHVRKECRCNDGKSIANKILKYLNPSYSTLDFVQRFNNNETFAHLEYINENSILFCYPECYCACVKRMPKDLSKTWCYCTLGNAEGVFTKVFKTNVRIELLETIKTGGKRCAMKVMW